MARHADTPEGRADDYGSCDGENRADPSSWDDPGIVTEPWAAPVKVAPTSDERPESILIEEA